MNESEGPTAKLFKNRITAVLNITMVMRIKTRWNSIFFLPSVITAMKEAPITSCDVELLFIIYIYVSIIRPNRRSFNFVN